MRDPDLLVGNGTVAARDLSSSGDVTKFESGRRCVTDGCRTILSSYNAGDRCWAHREATPVLSLGMRRTRAQEGPKVLNDREERALIQAMTAHRGGTIRPGRHPEPAPEPAPAPTPPPPGPVPPMRAVVGGR